MQTHITITVEHPDAMSASWVVEDVLRPFIKEANDTSVEGWSFFVSPSRDNKELRDRAVRTAISLALSEFPEGWSNEEILDNIHADLVLVWERFENWDADEIVEYINDTAVAIYTTYF